MRRRCWRPTRSCRSSGRSPGWRVCRWRLATSPSPGASWRCSPSACSDDQRVGDALTELGELAKRPEANIIKLPNVSASIPQLKAAIAELQSQGYDIPAYPDDPTTDEERDVRARYGRVQGLGRQPGAARGQLGPPSPALGQGVRPQAPPLDGRVEPRLDDQRGPHDRRRLPLQRALRGHRSRRRPAHRARRRRRHDHRAARVGAGAGRRDRRRHRHARRRPARRSSTPRSPGPWTTTCCSRCTSRPR